MNIERAAELVMKNIYQEKNVPAINEASVCLSDYNNTKKKINLLLLKRIKKLLHDSKNQREIFLKV